MMIMVVVDLIAATLCIASQCYPVLVGADTPRGEFVLTQRYVISPGYGGDVLQFKESERDLFAIHRVWLGNPKEKRLQRLASPDPRQRLITKGCINVTPEVYEELVKCCASSPLVVR